MEIPSRTPEGDSHHCPVCGKGLRIEPSTVPTPDAPCPHCGALLWFVKSPKGPQTSLEESRKAIARLLKEVAQLSETRLAPVEYYPRFLRRLLAPLAAPAGAVWLRKAQGAWELQAEINLGQVGLDRTENGRQMHDELLRQTALQGQARLISPRSEVGSPDHEGALGGANPTDYVVFLSPILVDEQVAGLVEVWQDPAHSPGAQRGMLRFTVCMAELASGYARKAAGGGAPV
jgi:hypothetical protein